MTKIRTFSDVPDTRLNQLVGDLQKEVNRDAIRVSSQSNGRWKVAVVVGEQPMSMPALRPAKFPEAI